MATTLPAVMAHRPLPPPISLSVPRPPKRCAPSPPPSSPLSPSPLTPWSYSPDAGSSVSFESPAAKRRRPNLANGFSSLSLAGHETREGDLLPSYAESQATRHQVDDEDDDTPLSLNDIRIQPLPDQRPPHPHWSVPNHASSSSASSSTDDDGGDESDTTFRHRRLRPPRTPAVFVASQQPSSIEEDLQVEQTGDLNVEDVTEHSSPHERKRHDTSSYPPARKRRRNQHDDDDMEMDEEICETSRHGTGRRTKWHEPEKDRIVITSLGSSPSTSRSSSPDRAHENGQRFSQPGDRGFTLNPSLLTHLLQSQRNNLHVPSPQERGLVLYRPLGVHAAQPNVEEIVKTWQEQLRAPTDASRFEEIGEDEIEWEGAHRGEDEKAVVNDGMDVEME